MKDNELVQDLVDACIVADDYLDDNDGDYSLEEVRDKLRKVIEIGMKRHPMVLTDYE